MSPVESGLYSLAETLSTPVYVLKENMPASEYFGWITYFSEQDKERKVREKMAAKQKPGAKNLLAGSTSDLISGLTGNG